ncbi:MAG: putative DNA binding domain-containing protein [Erysipelotrichaceae bacterium]|nr:putative DNA binding domain-containing protein [Erysipelotrichaceae bacterium]
MFRESDSIELKSQVIPDICKEVIGFANTNGGTVYIGIEDNGIIVGVDDEDKTILQLNNMIRDSIKPDITMFVKYEAIILEDKKVIVIKVQRGTDRPYYLGNKGLKPAGVYVRNGTSTDPASEANIRKMIKETDGDSFENMRSLEQNLSFNATNEQFKKRNIVFNEAKMKSLGLFLKDGEYSNVAFLLSDQCTATIKTATFNGTDKLNFQDRKEYSGSLFDQMENVYQYLEMRNKKRASFNGLYRIDTLDYPLDALREALLNCLVHRDYSFSASTLISVYDDRIEFVSVGGLPDGINLDDILLGISACRNPKLAAIFYRLELIEAYGTGIPKIMSSYKDTGFEPKIEVTNNAFKITLPNLNYSIDEQTETEDNRIVAFIDKNGFITRKDVEELLGISQTSANRILKDMVDKSVLYRIGNGKSIKYKKK